MGYTHYWDVTKDVSSDSFMWLTIDVRSIFDYAQLQGIALADGYANEGSAPCVSNNEIWFNGVGDDMFETFFFTDTAGSNFCKTGRKPYDIVVCAVLIAAKVRLGNLVKIGSDGRWSNKSEWVPAAKLYTEATGMPARNPITQ